MTSIDNSSDPQEQTELELVETLSNLLLLHDKSDESSVDGLDIDLIKYMAGMLNGHVAEQQVSIVSDVPLQVAIDEVLVPFLDNVQCSDAIISQVRSAVLDVLRHHYHPSNNNNNNSNTSSTLSSTSAIGTRKLTQGIVSLSSDLSNFYGPERLRKGKQSRQ
jgi:type III secretion system FlhB-like substrate exporter